MKILEIIVFLFVIVVLSDLFLVGVYKLLLFVLIAKIISR